MKQKERSEKEIVKEVEKLLEERGREALEMARKEILLERIESKEILEALKLFIAYFEDLARPTFMSLVCEAAGGHPDTTIPVAASMVLINGGIDIHDDIIDQSDKKLSHHTVFGKFGRDIALLAGDALLFKGFTLLSNSLRGRASDEKISSILQTLNSMFFELGNAEAFELRLKGRTDVSPEEYLRLVRKKSADVEALARISAILGGGSEDEIQKLGDYGRLLGMILILRDDILDTTDFEETLHRINKECLPLPILHALRSDKTESKLVSILNKQQLTEKDFKEIKESTSRSGGLKMTQEFIRDLANEACSIVRKADENRTLEAFAIATSIIL